MHSYNRYKNLFRADGMRKQAKEGNVEMDEIRIDNLEVFAHHGVYPEETLNGQNFYVNVILYTDTRLAGQKDELSLSTNYGVVCQFITKWMEEHTYQLIETVAETVAQEILQNFELVQGVSLEIRKPHAPIGLPFESVSVAITRTWHKVYLSIGSNMGDRRANLNLGIRELQENKQIRKVQISELLQTKPYGGVEQEDFLNGAIALETLLTPEELLVELHRIEALAGRERLIHWGPRTLDMDIIFFDKQIYESDTLIIPHVDMDKRYFVLKPLSELAPNFRHPILQKTVTQLLNEAGNEA